MTRLRHLLPLALSGLLAATSACTDPGEIGHDDFVDDGTGAFTSDQAVLVNFAFDGELTTARYGSSKSQIKSQLMYTVGHLNGEPGVSRLDRLALSSIHTTWIGGGLYRIRYHAVLPVAWGRIDAVPTQYELTLPRRIDGSGQNTFTARYGDTCNDGEDDSVNVSNYWYHYRPHAYGCEMADGDVSVSTADVTVSEDNTSGKYPEYHRVWEDGELRVVAVFAKYHDYATSNDDAGIRAYNRFVAATRDLLPGAVMTPDDVPSVPGVGRPDVTFRQRLADGRTVTITALLIDGVRTAGASFDTRYAELTPGADLILYNGHAGLGANVRALSKKGRFFPGKYQIFFMNGCDTFAYVDDTLARTRAALNPDDPTGTKYLDMVSNAMPAYFNSMPGGSMALIKAMIDYDRGPLTYQDIFSGIDGIQLVVVDGEADNVFTPDFDPGVEWNGFEASGAVEYHEMLPYQTEELQPGRYVFTLLADPTHPGGDADLRVRVGAEPTATSTYRCTSYRYNSNERCVVNVTEAAPVFMTVTGDRSGSSHYTVFGWQS